MNFVNNLKKINFVLFGFVFLFLVFPLRVYGGLNRFDLLDGLSWIVYHIVNLIGDLIGVVVKILINVAQYNNFINSQPVIVGWEIVRDLCNMGFVIVLLIIAIASILRIESYSYRTWLPKLVIMAVLINFSDKIAGIIIDISQIVMLTFVSGITNIGEGNFFDLLQINRYLNIDYSKEYEKIKGSPGKEKEVSAMNLFIAILLALIMALISLVVLGAITVVLIVRIVTLWVLVILSPFAYLFSASPIGHRYAVQWWQKFTQWIVTGPVMIFFIWLSLFTVRGTINTMFPSGTNDPYAAITEAGTTDAIGAFLLGTIMLMASLVVAQQLGGMAARVAGRAYNTVTTRGEKIARWGARKGAWVGGVATVGPVAGTAALMLGTKKGRQFMDWLNIKQAKKTGIDLNWSRLKKNIKREMESVREDDLSDIRREGKRGLGTHKNLKSFFTGFTSPGWYRNYVRDHTLGPVGGFFTAVKGTFKKDKAEKIKKLEDEKKKEEDEVIRLKKEKENIMTEEEKKKLETEKILAKDELNYAQQYRKNLRSTRLLKALNDLEKAIKQAQENKEKKARFGGGKDKYHQNYESKEYTLEELQEMYQKAFNEELKNKSKNEKERNNADKQIKKASEKLRFLENKLNKAITTSKSGKSFTSEDVKARKKEIEEQIKFQKAKIRDYEERINLLKQEQSEFLIDNYEARAEERRRRREEKHKLDISNSQEAVATFLAAVHSKDYDEAAAVVERLAETGDTNDLLEALNYNTKLGLTKKEIQKLQEKLKNGELSKEEFEEIIKEERGFHDFIRDYFVEKMGMNEQSAYELEADLGGIHKMTNQLIYSDAVSKGVDGKFRQNDNMTQQKLADAHLSKQDPERVARSFSRHAWGGENVHGEFEFAPHGINQILGNYKSIEKQIDLERFPSMNAIKFTEKKAIKQLEDAAELLSKEERKEFMQFLEKLKRYARIKKAMRKDENDLESDRLEAISKIQEKNKKAKYEGKSSDVFGEKKKAPMSGDKKES